MTPLDKNYLSLQFWNKIYTKTGSEFQTFFENIMMRGNPDFIKIRPYGRVGDGGNDGFIKTKGIYFQVYAPLNPVIREAEAAKKLTEDFEKLKNSWNNISKVREYNFVYNDQYRGSTQTLEQTIAELEKNNPNIVFKIINAKKLEEIFFSLDETDMLTLGFHIDSRIALNHAYGYLDIIKTALDKEYVNYAISLHNESKAIMMGMNDEKLLYEFELLEARYLYKSEKVEEAKNIYRSLNRKYPNYPQASLFLAEIYLYEKKYSDNLDLINSTPKDHPSNQIQVLTRKLTINEEINISELDEKLFPDIPKMKSDYYRLYSIYYNIRHDIIKADAFIEKAIQLNPYQFINYKVKISILIERLFSSPNENENENAERNSMELLNLLNQTENKYFDFSELSTRAQSNLLMLKLHVYLFQENTQLFLKTAKKVIPVLLKCYFDLRNENNLVSLLNIIYLSDGDLKELTKYLQKTSIPLSDELNQALIIQFSHQRKLIVDGKPFFKAINASRYYEFVNDIENENLIAIENILQQNSQFAISLAQSLHENPPLQKKIIEKLPNEIPEIKDQLLFQHYYYKGDIDNAFSVLKRIEVSTLRNSEILLDVVHKKKAWDLEITIIKKILNNEDNPEIILQYRLQLLQAYINLNNYLEVISLGKELLEEQVNKQTLETKFIESTLFHTLQAHLIRGEDNIALSLLNTYKIFGTSIHFKFNIEAYVYIRNNMPIEAQRSVVSAARIKKIFSAEEYAELYYTFLQIKNQMNYKIESLNMVKPDCFVKLTNNERFYYIGDDEAFDAARIDSHHNYFSIFLGKIVGDEIDLSNRYSSKTNMDTIEFILSEEEYLFWKSNHYFQKLSAEGHWEGGKIVEVTSVGDKIDTHYLEEYLNDIEEPKNQLFKVYCENTFPFALLAYAEGDLPKAISRIINENGGFIHISSGSSEEINSQFNVANGIIKNNSSFVIDGTSAFFLAEIGFFKKINAFNLNILVPQSVIAMLLKIAEDLRIKPGAAGRMGFVKGQITYHVIDESKLNQLRSNILESVKILELKRENILHISDANKTEGISKSIPPELSDGCIFAKEKNIPILTDDYLYLQMNEIETKKKAPLYFSSLSFIKALYHIQFLSFDDYLVFFGYLSSYRCRFLSFNSDDLYKAVFGGNKILRFKPEYIRQFNMRLTLSQEYGVSNATGLKVLVNFLVSILIDDAIAVEMVEQIFLELLNSLPSDKFNRQYGNLLIEITKGVIESISNIVLSDTVQKKQNKLSELLGIFNFGEERIYLL